MKKLDSRPDDKKLQQFLKYEKMNLKSHLYNKSNKTDRMFRDLNALQSKAPPGLMQTLASGGRNDSQQDISKEISEAQKIKIYQPII